MPRADFLTGLVFLLVALGLVAEGWRLPGAGGLIEEGGEPGRVPIFLGLVIAALALVLLVRAVGQGGHRLLAGEPLAPERRRMLVRAAATAAGCAFYAVGLLGRSIFGISLGYGWLTFGFILVFIVIAEWDLAPEISARRLRAIESRAPAVAARIAPRLAFVPAAWGPYAWLALTATLQAAALAAIVTYVFEQQFYVTLP